MDGQRGVFCYLGGFPLLVWGKQLLAASISIAMVSAAGLAAGYGLAPGSVCLWHTRFLTGYTRFLRRHFNELGFALTVIVLVLAISELANAFFERLMREYIRKLPRFSGLSMLPGGSPKIWPGFLRETFAQHLRRGAEIIEWAPHPCPESAGRASAPKHPWHG